MSIERPTPDELLTLSAYLDGELSSVEREALEARLAEDIELQAELEDLRQTVELVRSLPRLKAPRDFMLDPGIYGRQVVPEPKITFLSRGTIWKIGGGLAAAAAALVLMIAALLSLSGNQDSQTVQQSMMRRPSVEVAMDSTPSMSVTPALSQPEAEAQATQHAQTTLAPTTEAMMFTTATQVAMENRDQEDSTLERRLTMTALAIESVPLNGDSFEFTPADNEGIGAAIPNDTSQGQAGGAGGDIGDAPPAPPLHTPTAIPTMLMALPTSTLPFEISETSERAVETGTESVDSDMVEEPSIMEAAAPDVSDGSENGADEAVAEEDMGIAPATADDDALYDAAESETTTDFDNVFEITSWLVGGIIGMIMSIFALILSWLQ